MSSSQTCPLPSSSYQRDSRICRQHKFSLTRGTNRLLGPEVGKCSVGDRPLLYFGGRAYEGKGVRGQGRASGLALQAATPLRRTATRPRLCGAPRQGRRRAATGAKKHSLCESCHLRQGYLLRPTAAASAQVGWLGRAHSQSDANMLRGRSRVCLTPSGVIFPSSTSELTWAMASSSLAVLPNRQPRHTTQDSSFS